MKAQLVCAIVVIYASVALCGADFRQLMQQCMSETQVTEADLREFLASGMKTDAKENLKCYTKCLMEKQGHMSNGVFNGQATIDTLKNVPQLKDNIEEITAGVQACKDMKGTNDCDTAFKISMCLKEHKASMHH